MDLTIHSRNMEVNERIESYVEKKTARLDRYMPQLLDVRVDLSEQKTKNALDRHVAQITVRDERGTILRAEERSNDVFAAIDAVVEKLYRQIKRYRGKRRDSRRAPRPDLVAELELEPLPIPEAETVEEEAVEGQIVRRKRFMLQPMSTEEAIEQMELLGHDFFVFFDAEEEAINVLYRRRDENYGLLQPELY